MSLLEMLTAICARTLALFYDSIIQTIGYEEVTTYDPGTGEVDEVNIYWRGGRTDLRYGADFELILDQRGTYNTGIGNTISISANVHR